MSFESKSIVKNPVKQKRCYWCGEWCEIGQPRVNTAGVWDGDFYSNQYHPECNDARSKWWSLNRMEYFSPEEGTMIRGSLEWRVEP